METILEMRNIVKDFPGTRAVDHVSLQVNRGEVHAIVGQNGAGKSTLVKILTGVLEKSDGEIWLEGKKVEVKGPQHARVLGISCVHQELNLVPSMNVMENLFLGSKYPRNHFGLVDWQQMAERTKGLLAQVGLDVPPKIPVRELSVANQWMVAIARALFLKAKILILDEPTAALTRDEIATLFSIIARLKQQGMAILYISHRLEEIFQIADRVTVMKDGKHVTTVEIGQVDMDALIKLIVGKEIKQLYPKEEMPRGERLLSVSGLGHGESVAGVSFDLYAGEILGFAGLVGAGRTQVARLIFGADRKKCGVIYLAGRPLRIDSPRDAIREGIALVPEERRKQGLVMGMSIRENITLTNLRACRRWPWVGLISHRKERNAAQQLIHLLNIVCTGADQPVRLLSGGNQQKVVLAKGLFCKAKVYIFDEPTQGVDIGSKTELYLLMQHLAKEGNGVIFISSDLKELIGICDRLLVFHQGHVVAELSREEMSEDRVLSYCYGGCQR